MTHDAARAALESAKNYIAAYRDDLLRDFCAPTDERVPDRSTMDADDAEIVAEAEAEIAKIDAALASLSAASGEPCAVKPLEWVEREGVSGTFNANTSIGHYIATITDDGRGMWFIVGQTTSNYMIANIGAVQRAAQADYEQRIRSALVTTPQPAAGWDEGAAHGWRVGRDACINWCGTNGYPDVAKALFVLPAAKAGCTALRREAPAPAEGVKPSSIVTCCVTGAIPGDGGACGDCDPCIMGETSVPEPVKRLIAEKNSLLQRVGELEDAAAAGASAEARLREALTGLVEAVRRDADEDGKGISWYTSARLGDARAALSPSGGDDSEVERLRDALSLALQYIPAQPTDSDAAKDIERVHDLIAGRAKARDERSPGGDKAKESKGGVPPFGGAEAAIAAADGNAQTCHETFKALRKIIDLAYDALAMTWDQSGMPGPSDPTAAERREIVAKSVRTFCNSVSPASVQISSDGIERIYYAGLSVPGLVDAILAALDGGR